MRTLYESILDDEDEKLDTMGDEIINTQWIKDNFYINGKLTIKDGIANVDGGLCVKNKNITSLTNGLFKWGEVTCEVEFQRSHLESLQGGPIKVGGNYYVYNCPYLKSLEGAPEEIEGEFSCWACDALIDLKGAPKKVGGFFCNNCKNLKSLDGSPEYVYGVFFCNGCPKLNTLRSIKGAPKYIEGQIAQDYNTYSIIADDNNNKVSIIKNK